LSIDKSARVSSHWSFSSLESRRTLNAYSTHDADVAWWFCRFRKEQNKKEAGAVKQAEADFIKNPDRASLYKDSSFFLTHQFTIYVCYIAILHTLGLQPQSTPSGNRCFRAAARYGLDSGITDTAVSAIALVFSFFQYP
jgi:hypothetical protein